MRALCKVAALFGGFGILAACDDEFMVPDLNNPGIESLAENPTPAAIFVAAQGLMIGGRAGHTGQISTTSHLGIFGRESLVFDPSDPRYISEMLAGNLNAGNGAFGGFGWAPRYANLRNASIVLNATDAVIDDPSVGIVESDKAAIRGFTKTIEALDFYWLIMLRNDNGAVIDVNRPFGAELAPIEPKVVVLDHIEALLDEANADLADAGETFPFELTSGFDGFDSPSTFREFNRALLARVQVLRGEYGQAVNTLATTWVGIGADLDEGVYHVFSTNAGDATNGLFQGESPQIVAHPSLVDRVQTHAGSRDDRFRRKVSFLEAEQADPRGVRSNVRFEHYPTPSSPLPIIRNEELLLLRAEARWFTGDRAGAMADLNHVRTVSGELPAIETIPSTDAGFIDLLLYERQFSLLFEGGHRWIDMRRFGRLDEVPRDRPSDQIPTSLPIPRNECNARGTDGPCGAAG